MSRLFGQEYRWDCSYRFENFLTASSNLEAFQVCRQVAAAPLGSLYNPLLIANDYSGDGATHLTTALATAIMEHRPGTNIIMLPAERFLNARVRATNLGKLREFNHQYRSADALLVEEISFILDKPEVLQELALIIGYLLDAGRQVVVNGCDLDSYRSQLRQLLGVDYAIVRIGRSDKELRLAKLKRLAVEWQVTVSTDVLALIAAICHESIRHVEGAFYRMAAYAQLNSRPMDSTLILDVLAFIDTGIG